jgi:hypothetical protein
MVTKSLEKTKNVALVYEFFKQFSIWCGSSPVTPTPHELEKYLTKDVQMTTNGQLVVKSAADYLERIKKLQKKYSFFQISEPIIEPITSGHHATIYYKIDLTTHKGEHKQVFIMGSFAIEEDKIKRWVQVTAEKDAGNWDK